MSDEIEISEEPKAKRKYTPRKPKEAIAPIQQPIAPPPPNPTILAQESKIGELTERRFQVQHVMNQVNRKVQDAQRELSSVQEEFNRITEEINYRMNVIRQLRGEPAQIQAPQIPQDSPYAYGNNISASAPWNNQPSVRPLSAPYAPAAPYPAYPPPYGQGPREMTEADEFGRASIPSMQKLYPDLGPGGPENPTSHTAVDIRAEPIDRRGY